MATATADTANQEFNRLLYVTLPQAERDQRLGIIAQLKELAAGSHKLITRAATIGVDLR